MKSAVSVRIAMVLMVFAWPISLIAQITLDSTDFPLPDTFFRRFYALADTVGSPGPEQHYNFKECMVVLSDTMKYLDASATSFYAEHPGSSVAVLQEYDFDVYYFFSHNDEAYWESGTTLIGDFGEGLDTVSGNSPPGFGDTVISEQYTYGYNTIQHSCTIIPVNILVSVDMHKVKEIEADGWGSLSTPFNEFPEVLRVKYTEYRADSIFVLGSFSSANYDTLWYYRYFAKGVRHPVVIAHTDSNGVMQYFEMVRIQHPVPGCTDTTAVNFNPFATEDDGTCVWCTPIDYTVTPDTSVCRGTPITLQVTGGNAWLWSTGDTSSSISFVADTSESFGVYVGSQPLCLELATVSVTVSEPVVAGFWVSDVHPDIADSVLFVNTSVNATDYLWDFGDTDGGVSSLTNPKYQFTSLGDKEVTLVASNICYSDTFTYTITVTAIEETENLLSDFSVYPNPGNMNSYIQFTVPAPADVSFSFTDLYGRCVPGRSVKSVPAGTQRFRIGDVCRDLPEGMWLIRVKAGENIYIIKWLLNATSW
ncbi:MAG: hypothetical protein KJ607_11015 [Bacteroidetes bacterium]|nr:hypothetical protein [Bacteroidota bacterium]